MPLHLLGKKSWNPYAPAAIARVKADEEAAATRERHLDELRDDHDARLRLARMRGETSPPLPDELAALEVEDVDASVGIGQKRKSAEPAAIDRRRKRRLPGEDDTDRDLRLAREQREAADAHAKERAAKAPRSDAPIVDSAGHIQLFAPEDALRKSRKTEKNPEAEAERRQQQREVEDQYTMRFSNAAGFKENIKDSPWYLAGAADDSKSVGRNAFGREDQGRHQRDAARVSTADPMAAMKAAQAKLKDVRRARDNIQRERDDELRVLKEDQDRAESRRHQRRHRHHDRDRDRDREHSRRKHNNPDELEGFSLDVAPQHQEHRHKHRHRDDHSSRSRHGRGSR